MKNLGVLFSVMLLITACGDSLPRKSGSVSGHEFGAGIIGGKVVTEKDPLAFSVVAIRSKDTAESEGPFCTGTLVAPQVILTAAHCLFDDEGSAQDLSQLEVVFNINGRIQDPLRLRKVKEAQVLPGYKNIVGPLATCPFGPCPKGDEFAEFNPHDMALLKIDRPAPSDAQIASLMASARDLKDGQKITVAGYGFNVPTSEILADGSEQSKIQSGTLRAMSAKVLFVANKKKVREVFHKLYLEDSPEKSICEGDSGGPMFNADSTVLVGIASHLASVDLSYPCRARLTAYTDVSAFLPWIRSTVQKMGATAK